MSRIKTAFFLALMFIGMCVSVAQAVYAPLSVPNNKFGVHILEPAELSNAAKLVNSSGGDWGYVTIPMRSNDRDREKWLEFFKRSRELHVIPLIRLSTFVYGDTWVTPSSYDLVDFANFLDEMPWPTANRYIILFNEPNHANEWGGKVDPVHYASLLFQAKEIFKSRSADYFLLTAGLDMSAPTNHNSLDALTFYRQMTAAWPNWFQAVDGFSFHSYPNPAFSSPVKSKTRYGLSSYKYELNLFKSLKIPAKPIFITETGTINPTPDFYLDAFSEIWTEPDIVAVTPFLLFAGEGPFASFSLLDKNHQPKPTYQAIFNLKKEKGSPLLNSAPYPVPNIVFPVSPQTLGPLTTIMDRFNQLIERRKPKLVIADKIAVTVEVADNHSSRTRGLSGRPGLPPDHGMLFIFPQPQPQKFWMHDMNFALDFLWIRDKKIVEITANVPPPAQTGGVPKTVAPSKPCDWVLEVPAGFVSSHDIKVGDEVEFRP